ncbi:MAG: multicopper oxidase domain-containing protein [Cycloclasticus sp.]|nr:multicopper oxidase domain-containing protein [Cycloclasticus sp.]MBQ0789047.1 multicopper oxidase domain-containing protein [Cycloclasticus sp.]
MIKRAGALLITLLLLTSVSQASMRMGDWGMVMNENTQQLPQGCGSIAGEQSVTVKAGHEYAKAFPGTIFGYDQHSFSFPRCTRVTVNFINEDQIRHQFMIHGLPTYLHPQGMFHMELYGEGEVQGTFITPNTEETYLAHCDVAQHMEKGMKAQVKVGGGNGDLPSIPGVSGQLNKDRYALDFGFQNILLISFLFLLGFASCLFLYLRLKK